MATSRLHHDGLVFDVHEAGPPGGEPVVLLHGFPQFSDSWDGLAPLLHAAGYRTVAMDQRGYSPGARPRGRRAYTMPRITGDASALLDHVGVPAHVVGHDWGAVTAWSLAAQRPDRVRTLTALSVPHPQAFLTSFVTSPQLLRSWYMIAFQLPRLPEKLITVRRGARALVRTGQSPQAAHRDAARLCGDALTGPLNWYRAMPLVDPRAGRRPVTVPTLFVWSDGDSAIGRAAAQRCARYVEGPYRFAVLGGVSHWIPDEAPTELAALMLPHLAR